MVKKKLSDNFLKALTEARTTVRKKAVEFIIGEIQAIYEIGKHPKTEEPIQSCEILVKDGNKIVERNYVFVGVDTIQTIFGEAKEDKTLTNIVYDDGVPKSLPVPDCPANADGQYWFTLPKK